MIGTTRPLISRLLARRTQPPLLLTAASTAAIDVAAYLGCAVALYWALARMAFRRQLAYRTANLAGLVANGFFGYLRAAMFVATFASTPAGSIAGYDVQSATTYVWVTQALIMVLNLWGWWDVELTIRSGDVVSDLARPFSYLGYWLARDYGRAAYFLLFRALPSVVLGQLAVSSGLRWPGDQLTWLGLMASIVLSIAVAFAWRFLLNLSAFWTTDARGLGALAGVVQGAAVLVIATRNAGINWTPDKLLVLVMALASGIAIFFSIFVLAASFCFWTTEGKEATHVFSYGGVTLVDYPIDIYANWLKRFVTFVLPLAFVSYYPALYLLERPDPLGLPVWLRLLSPVAALALAGLAAAAWSLGVQRYQSTGS